MKHNPLLISGMRQMKGGLRVTICAAVLAASILCTEAAATLKEWCKAVPTEGLADIAVCQPADKTQARYTIEVVPVVGSGFDLQSDVTAILVGSGEKRTEPITIASKATGTEKKIFADAADIGDCQSVVLKLSSLGKWKCQRVTVWKDYRYWVFDCVGSLDVKNPEATLAMSGNKLYEASVQTGNDEKAGTHGGVEITLIGEEGEASPKLLKQGFYPASQKKIRFRAADVGELTKLLLTNTADEDPWYCDFIRIKTEEGTVYPFTVKRWIGAPYDRSATVDLKPSKMLDLPAQDVECHTRGADMFSRIPEELQIFKVRCPMNCQASEFAHVEGSTIHPASTTICAAAILDGVLSPSGGEVVVSVTGALPEYFGMSSDTGVNSTDYSPAPDKPAFSFYLYRSHSIDDIDTNVRVVDAYGKLSATGRVEIRRKGAWGSICKKGDFAEFTSDSAKKACRELGYLHGILLESCSYVDGQNVCAGQGYPVAVAGVMCNGAEAEFADCTFEEPTDLCRDHMSDVAVQCTNNPPDREPQAGTLRIVDASGAPSQAGIGRLEFYQNGFGTVCDDGWTKESERVACLEMGYTGLKSGGYSDKPCSDVAGVNYCAGVKNKIAVVNVQCQGDEISLRHCQHETNNDIYCVHDEDIVVGCEGNGDPSGIGLFVKEELPSVGERPFAPKLKLDCGDRPISKPELKGQPGAMFIVECPEGCSEEAGSIKGTFVYSDDSPICKAAVHAGALEENGGEAVVTLGHGQKSFSGTERHGISSESFGPYLRTFSVSFPVSSVQAQTALQGDAEAKAEKNKKFAGASALKTSGSFPSFRELYEGDKTATNMIPDKFHWSSSEEWKGFRGKIGDFIDADRVPGGDPTPGFRDFSFSARAKVTGGKGTWRTILAHSECEGFQLAVDDKDEVVFEQTCSSNFIQSGFKPPLNEWFHVIVSYYRPEKHVTMFVDGRPVADQTVDNEFDLKNHLIIGRSVGTDSDYFVGDITAVRAFDYVLSPSDAKLVMKESVEAGPGSSLSASKTDRRTLDGRLCLTPCTAEEPASVELREAHPTNIPIVLSCQDILASSGLNGRTDQKFRISCPANCAEESGTVKGTRVYTDDTPICKAACHTGVVSNPGGDAVLTLHNGLSEYVGSRGREGVFSIDDRTPHLWSYSLCRAPEIKLLSCQENGSFLLKMGLEERELISCPKDCGNAPSAPVYGTDVYSAQSSVCRAAIHSGALGEEGGKTEIRVLPERDHFVASNRNGIESQQGGKYLRSFSFVTTPSMPHASPLSHFEL